MTEGKRRKAKGKMENRRFYLFPFAFYLSLLLGGVGLGLVWAGVMQGIPKDRDE